MSFIRKYVLISWKISFIIERRKIRPLRKNYYIRRINIIKLKIKSSVYLKNNGINWRYKERKSWLHTIVNLKQIKYTNNWGFKF